MKTNILSKLISSTLIAAVGLIGSQAFAQKRVKNINLSVGIYHDEPIANIPPNFDPAGTYKQCAQLQYNDQTKTLRIDPKKDGFCTLTLKHPTTSAVLAEYTLDVKKTDLNKVAREIKALLNEIEGIQIKIANNKVIVDGQVLLPKDVGRIHTVVKQYGDLATHFVTLSPAAEVKIAQFIERAIGNPEIHVKAVNGKFLLEGVAENKDEKDKAEIIAKTYAPDFVTDQAVTDRVVGLRIGSNESIINLITVKEAAAPEPSKTVQIMVHYVELSKDYSNGFRFQWTPDVGDGSAVTFSNGARGPSGITSTITGTISNLLPKLNWAKEHGHARVLQSSSIVVEDGKAGRLDAGQRVPYQSVTAQGQPTTNFEDVGIMAEITPQIQGTRSDSVNLKMNFSIKNLLGDVAAGPLISQRKITTQLTIKSGQSAAVGGLVSNDTATGYNRLPANASSNPIISLYASKSFRRNQSQFVVFVTPVIKTSASAGAEQIKRRFRLRD
jgi:pilus assembly protein CpaC